MHVPINNNIQFQILKYKMPMQINLKGISHLSTKE